MSSKGKASFLDMMMAVEVELINRVTQRCWKSQMLIDSDAMRKAFRKWTDLTGELRKIDQAREAKQRFYDTLKNSTRGQRSTMEKEIIRRYLTNTMTCIPKAVTFSEMDTLCNELDFYPHVGRSIIFLQGDFGNCYYMVASGRVGLYLEPSKDREMTIAREFGHLRGQQFHGSDEELERLGNNIFNLPTGAGFGEYAILADTNKIRSCAAVSIDADVMLLIMHAETYNTVLRQHHYRQKQLSSAIKLLQELPLFKSQHYSKVASVAYTMKSQTYSNQSTVVKYGDPINNVLLIASGQVKVFAAPKEDDPKDNALKNVHLQKILKKRMPKMAIALLGRGQIIGEMEVQQQHRTFQMSYEASAIGTEILEMPATVFKDSISGGSFQHSLIYKSIEAINKDKDLRRAGRMTRAYDAMKSMMSGDAQDIRTREELTNILPVIIQPPKDDFYSNNNSSSSSRSNATGTGAYSSPTAANIAGSSSSSKKTRRGSSFGGGGYTAAAAAAAAAAGSNSNSNSNSINNSSSSSSNSSAFYAPKSYMSPFHSGFDASDSKVTRKPSFAVSSFTAATTATTTASTGATTPRKQSMLSGAMSTAVAATTAATTTAVSPSKPSLKARSISFNHGSRKISTSRA